jgi:hypothetical protein
LRRTWWPWRFKHHRFILLAFPCALGGEELWAQASNDNCGFAAGNEYFVSAACNPMAFNKPNTFGNTMVPAGCNSGNFGDAFGWFSGTGNPVIVQYDPNAGDAVLHVLTGTCAASTVVGCSDVGLGGAIETVTIPTTLGTNYIVRVQRYNSSNTMNGTLCIYNAPPPPANDDPCNATAAAVNGDLICTLTTPSTLVAATASGNPTTPCFGNPDNDVWFQFTASSTTHFISLLNVAGTEIDLYHAVYTGTCGSLANISCSDNDNSTLSGLTVGTTYWIRVYTYFTSAPGDVSTFDLCITTPVPINCGDPFYDPGGPATNYANNTNYVQTICPTNPGDLVTLNFTAFQTEPGIDELNVYNGPSTLYSLIGSFSGSTLPPTVVATNPSGCLTVEFTSDYSVNYPGWAATVACQTPPAGDCVYVLQLFDSNGNGWGASNVGVNINGLGWNNYTTTGSGNTFLLGLNIGDQIELQYNASGPNQGQNSYSLSMFGGTPYFTSGSPPVAGVSFTQTVTCTPPPAPPQDCTGGVTLCNSQSITNSSDNTGWSDDLDASNQGCLSSGERQGTWYFFSPQTAGTIAFSIAPGNGTDDYDFAVWGPYPNAHCPTEQPLRCSYALPGSYTTGLNGTATDPSEGISGNGWVQDIDALAGEVYVLYIDDFSLSGQDFTLNWQLSGGSSLDCTVLPLELLSFQARPRGTVIDLAWSTASERNTDLFEVQRSADNHQFTAIGHMDAAGESLQQLDYLFTDPDPLTGANYYRLKLLDLDGTYTYSQVEVAFMDRGQGARPLLFPNPATELLRLAFHAPMEGPATIRIQDAVGRTVATHQAALARGANAVDIPLLQLADGWYSVAVGLPDDTPLPTGSFLKH